MRSLTVYINVLVIARVVAVNVCPSRDFIVAIDDSRVVADEHRREQFASFDGGLRQSAGLLAGEVLERLELFHADLYVFCGPVHFVALERGNRQAEMSSQLLGDDCDGLWTVVAALFKLRRIAAKVFKLEEIPRAV